MFYPGKQLPKRILRPFWHNPSTKLDNNEYRVISSSDKTFALGGFSYVLYTLSGISFIVWAILDFKSTSELIIALVFLGGAILMQVTSKLFKPTRFIEFNRKDNYISIPKMFSKKRISGPWEEWTARISMSASSVGAPRNRLWLVHLPTKSGLELDSSITTIDSLLGYWSFIVQFMDSKGPYPNVPELKNEKNLTNGLGTWEHWEKTGKYESDPYQEWLQELKADPNLDIAYRDT